MPSQYPQWRLPLNFMPIRGPAGTWGWGWGARAPEGSQTLLIIKWHVRLPYMYCKGLQIPLVMFACPKKYFSRLHAGALFGGQNREGVTGCLNP